MVFAGVRGGEVVVREPWEGASVQGAAKLTEDFEGALACGGVLGRVGGERR